MHQPAIELVWPAAAYLEGFRDALVRDWSPDSMRGADAAREELAQLDADPVAYVAAQVDREALGAPITLPSGRRVPRLPGFRRWIWDGAFAGLINLRWQRGTAELPSYVLGHIGYVVVPWRQGRGYATRALALMLDDARAEGLPYVTLTTDLANVASQRVIASNGGRVVDTFDKPVEYDDPTQSLRWRIDLARP